MATKLNISDLADVLAKLKEVTKPYQLGIQLKIDSSELDTIERNHPKDIDRQKTEVIKYWLRNSPDPSWTTLASALERMGGHARLTRTLSRKERKTDGCMQAAVASGVEGDEEGSRDEQSSEEPFNVLFDNPFKFGLHRHTYSHTCLYIYIHVDYPCIVYFGKETKHW